MGKISAIIVDIDETLANTGHRVHFVKQKPRDWDSYYAGMDEVNLWCREIVMAMFCRRKKILFVTGRPEKYRLTTIDWIKSSAFNGISPGPATWELLMRPDDDFRPDNVLKKEIWEREIKDKYDVLFVIEDRLRVVQMWRSIGLTCLQCVDGNY